MVKKAGKAGLVIGLGLVAYAAYQGIKAVDEKAQEFYNGLSIEPGKLQFNKSGLNIFSTRFTFFLQIFNLSDFEVPIRSISGVLKTNGTTLATFVQNTNLKLAANVRTVVGLNVTASNITTLITLVQIYQSGKTPKIDLTGKVITPYGTAPIDNSFPSITIVQKD